MSNAINPAITHDVKRDFGARRNAFALLSLRMDLRSTRAFASGVIQKSIANLSTHFARTSFRRRENKEDRHREKRRRDKEGRNPPREAIQALDRETIEEDEKQKT